MKLGNVTVILFYANWCPHCKTILPLWEQLEKDFKNDLKVTKLEQSEIENFWKSGKRKTKDEEIILDTAREVNGYPTIIGIEKNNDIILHIYNGLRNKTELKKFLKNMKTKS